jgi:hypothetical protein
MKTIYITHEVYVFQNGMILLIFSPFRLERDFCYKELK